MRPRRRCHHHALHGLAVNQREQACRLTDAQMRVIARANDDESISNFYADSPYGETVALGPDEGNPLQYTRRENRERGNSNRSQDGRPRCRTPR